MRVIPPPPLLPSPLAQPGGHALSTCLELRASCLDGVSDLPAVDSIPNAVGYVSLSSVE